MPLLSRDSDRLTCIFYQSTCTLCLRGLIDIKQNTFQWWQPGFSWQTGDESQIFGKRVIRLSCSGLTKYGSSSEYVGQGINKLCNAMYSGTPVQPVLSRYRTGNKPKIVKLQDKQPKDEDTTHCTSWRALQICMFTVHCERHIVFTSFVSLLRKYRLKPI